MTDNYKEQIGRHLGRTMTGELMTPYEAPEQHDPGLLVPIPREVGRTGSNITSPMKGYDVWHAYEFSFLLKNNRPVTGVLKFSIPITSEVMIESKSFKLYLNSFDFEKFENSSEVGKFLTKELSELVPGIQVGFFKGQHSPNKRTLVSFNTVDYNEYKDHEFTFIEDATKLKISEDEYFNFDKIQTFHTANLRSACEITNQKDTGHAFIAMKGHKQFDPASIADYIYSMRDSQHFHENVTEIIYDTMYKHYEPDELFVLNVYNRRGGLDIHPARFTSHIFADIVLGFKYDDVHTFFTLTNQV